MTELVSIAKAGKDIRASVEAGLAPIDLSIRADTPIIIKPNLCCVKTCETGATTDSRIVEALIDYFKSRFKSEKFYIVESDATMLNADIAFQILGYARVAQKTGANIVNLSKIPSEKMSFPNNIVQTKVRIPELFKKPHFLISVAKMKTSDTVGVSANLKNVFGCNPEWRKMKYHRLLHQNIADFATAFRPSLSIVDGIVGMEGMGPIDGTPVRVGTLLFGTDPVATDHATARVMGFNPNDLQLLEICRRHGVGTFQYKLLGVNLSQVRVDFRKPTTVIRRLYSSKVFRFIKTYSKAASMLVMPHDKQ